MSHARQRRQYGPPNSADRSPIGGIGKSSHPCKINGGAVLRGKPEPMLRGRTLCLAQGGPSGSAKRQRLSRINAGISFSRHCSRKSKYWVRRRMSETTTDGQLAGDTAAKPVAHMGWPRVVIIGGGFGGIAAAR